MQAEKKTCCEKQKKSIEKKNGRHPLAQRRLSVETYLEILSMKQDERVWTTDESLKKIKPVLEERANSTGGEC